MTNDLVSGDKAAQAIFASPSYKHLVGSRLRTQLTLTALMLMGYYGFILLVAFGKHTLAQRLGDSIFTLAIPVGLFVATLCVLTTGYYVRAANQRFDELNRAVATEGAK